MVTATSSTQTSSTQTTKKPGPFRLLKDGISRLEQAGKILDTGTLFWKIEVIPTLTEAKVTLAELAGGSRDWKKVQSTIDRLVAVLPITEEILSNVLNARRVETVRADIRRSVASIETAIRVEAKRQETKRSLPNHGELVDLKELGHLTTGAEGVANGSKSTWTLAELEVIRTRIRGEEQQLWLLIKTSCDHCGQPKGNKPVVFEKELTDGRKIHREYCSAECNKEAFIHARDRNAAERKANQRKPHAA